MGSDDKIPQHKARVFDVYGSSFGRPGQTVLLDNLAALTTNLYEPGDVLIIGNFYWCAQWHDLFTKAGVDVARVLRFEHRKTAKHGEVPLCLASHRDTQEFIRLILKGEHKALEGETALSDADGYQLVKTSNQYEIRPGQIKAVVLWNEDSEEHEKYLPLLIQRCPDITIYVVRTFYGWDWFTDEERKAIKASPTGLIPRGLTEKPLVVSEINDFLQQEIPDREVLLLTSGTDTAVFYKQSLNQLFAWRGTGKSMTAMALAGAMARGESFLAWKATRPCRVVYVEGEMPSSQVQQRLRQLVGPVAAPGRFRLITIDQQPDNQIPSLATAEGRQALEEALQPDDDVLVIDSISTLVNIPTNDEENWLGFLAWLRRLRSKGLCVLFLHHAGKSGMQRGHSRSEDMLDVSIKLEGSGEESDDLLFSLKFDKFRSRRKGVRSLAVRFHEGQWSHSALEADELEALRSYLEVNPNASARKIEEDLKIDRRRVSALREKLGKAPADSKPDKESLF